MMTAYHPSNTSPKSGKVAPLLLLCLLFLGILLGLYTPIGQSEAVSIDTVETTDLNQGGQLYHADSEAFPSSVADIPNFIAQRSPVQNVSLLGGSYWYHVELRNSSNIATWVMNPSGTLIENVDVKFYSEGGLVQAFKTGYTADHDYMLHYGKEVFFPPGSKGQLLLRFDSPYFASFPDFEWLSVEAFKYRVSWENVLALFAFGALLTLALYNFFIFITTTDRAYLYYALYLTAYFLAWAFTFHLPAELFDLHNLQLHYIFFFFLPILNTLFYIEFLELKKRAPRLAAWSRVNYWLPLLLLPSCFIALHYAHVLATLAIGYWLILALVSSIVCMRRGFRPARYFVFAFTALLLPGLIILPANLGLIPDLVRNSELFTLLGGTFDAILLALALADKIRILSSDKDEALHSLHKMLAITRTDHLTGIANRHAFDQDFNQVFNLSTEELDGSKKALYLIDLDGMKRINDRHGHLSGDKLLCTFAQHLSTLEIDDCKVYRIGGDEFTVIAPIDRKSNINIAIANIEKKLHEHEFRGVGVSYGIAHSHECQSTHDMFSLADKRMYEYKTLNRHARADDTTPLTQIVGH
jgi:diguanylate cyclase (GGDEF)-like protein